jgi:hypothetical protein
MTSLPADISEKLAMQSAYEPGALDHLEPSIHSERDLGAAKRARGVSITHCPEAWRRCRPTSGDVSTVALGARTRWQRHRLW